MPQRTSGSESQLLSDTKKGFIPSCSENSSRPLAPHDQHLGSHCCSATGLLVGVKSPSSLETCMALSLLRCFCLETRGSWCKWSRAAKITSHFSPSCGWCRKEVKIKGVWKVHSSGRLAKVLGEFPLELWHILLYEPVIASIQWSMVEFRLTFFCFVFGGLFVCCCCLFCFLFL